LVVLALAFPSTAAAQDLDAAFFDEVVSFADYVKVSNNSALLFGAVSFFVLVATLNRLSAHSRRKPRNPWNEWLCLLLVPPFLCFGWILLGTDASIERAPLAECNILKDQRPLSIPSAAQRERVEDGLGLCAAAEAGRLPFAIHVGVTPIVLLSVIGLAVTVGIWYWTNRRVVLHSSA